MATKRMFSNMVVDSDKFLDLSPMQQLLYFHCGMKTDDDGFVGGAKRIGRIIGASAEDFTALVENGFLIEFPASKVYCVVHHRQNNNIQNDRYHRTDYQQEFAQLELTENKEWRLKQPENKADTDSIQDDSKMDTDSIQNDSNVYPEPNVTHSNVTEPIVTHESVEEGSDEGRNQSAKLLLQWAMSFLSPADCRTLEKYLLEGGEPEQARIAIHKWRDNNREGRFTDYFERG